jgi:hypothetical protein
MRINKIILFLMLFAGTAWVVSCDKTEESEIIENLDLDNKAFIKVHNGVLNSARNNIYVDNAPVTGVAAVFPYNAVYPSTVFGVGVDAGSRTILIKDTSATTTQTPITFTQNFDAGKTYTIFTYDTVNQAKYKIVETPIVIPTDTTARLRFANFIFSRTPVPNVDLYSVKAGANIFTNVPVEGVTEFITYRSRVTDSLYVRATGTLTNLTPVFTINPTEKRSYTIVFRGRYQTTGTTGIARMLTTVTNY